MNFLKNGGQMGFGIALGIGATMLIPTLSKVVAGAARPLMKESMKGGMYLTEKGKVLLAEAKESLEDLSAEVKSEKSAEEKKSKSKSKSAKG